MANEQIQGSSQEVPQSLKTTDKKPLDGRMRFATFAEAQAEAYEGATFYVAELKEWYKFKPNAQGVLVGTPDSSIDASQFALKTDLNGLAPNTMASASTNGLMSTADYAKLLSIDTSRITKVRASANNGKILINDVETVVYTRPDTATDRPVSDAEKTVWNGKAEAIHYHDSRYAPLAHNHNTLYAPLAHEHQVWDSVLGRYREKYVLADSAGSGGNATTLGGLALNNAATGIGEDDGLWSAAKTLSVVNTKVNELSTGLSWKPAVPTFADIATTYPNPVDGWTVPVAENPDSSWRFNGTEWIEIPSGMIPMASPTVDGKMSAIDKAKLDGIEDNANSYVHPAKHLASVIEEETDKRFMLDAERAKLAGVAANANNYVHPASHPASIITEEVNKRFMSDAERSKLALIDDEATRTPVGDVTPLPLGVADPGVSPNAAREDHVHALPSVVTTSANGMMLATDKSKLDGIAASATNTPLSSTTPAALGTAAVGTGTTAARADHVHALPAVVTTSVNGLMSAADKTKLDGIATGATALALSSTTPAALGTAAVGTGTTAARADHVHALPAVVTTSVNGLMLATDKTKIDGIADGATNTPLTSTTPSPVTTGTAAVGTATTAARADHSHKLNLSSTVAKPLASAASAGTSNGVSRDDHVHPLPSVATAVADGLMAMGDKSKLDGIAASATNTPLSSTTPAALGTAAVGTGTTAARADHVHALPALATSSSAGLMSATDKGLFDSLNFPSPIAASEDLNTYTKPGFYYCGVSATVATLANCPTTIAFSMLVEKHAGAKQTLTQFDSSGPFRIYVRNYYNTVWSPWYELLVSGLMSNAKPTALGTAAPGTSIKPSREDHVHPLPVVVTTSVNGLMLATDKSKLDGIAASATNTPLSSTTPAALGTAAVGTGTTAARADHVHALPAAATTSVAGLMSAADKTKLDGIATGATALALSSTTPAALGTAAVGTGTTAARADHVHALPAVVTTSVNGLMLATDKVKVDNLSATYAASPATTVDNALVRFDGTTGQIQASSGATLSDTGVLTVIDVIIS